MTELFESLINTNRNIFQRINHYYLVDIIQTEKFKVEFNFGKI